MARGSFWHELGRDRERRRRADVARVRAEAQIRKDARRAAAGTERETAAELRARGEADAAELQASCFDAFPREIVDTVTVNGFVVDTDPATGRPARPCLVTVNAARATFDELELDSLELRAQECLVRLEAEISPNPYALEPVEPLVDVEVFRRYRLTEPDGLAVLDHRVDLMEMHPREFEKLVVALFAEMGYRSWPTRYSHDDGIDGVAVKDDPHLPSECLIQVKRTRNRVSPTTVQALMGALVENPRATHGYFVTTSWFSPQTRRRARERRIQTMEGPQLREYIATYLKRDVLISVMPPARRR